MNTVRWYACLFAIFAISAAIYHHFSLHPVGVMVDVVEFVADVVPDTVPEPDDELLEVEIVPAVELRIPTDQEILDLEAGLIGDESSVGVQALPPRDSWMAEFNKTRRRLIIEKPLCEACGRSADDVKKRSSNGFGQIDMHHKIPVKDIIKHRLSRKLLTDHDNMIMLCRDEHGGCHLHIGHTINGVSNFSTSNPDVEADSKKNFHKLWPRLPYIHVTNDWRIRKENGNMPEFDERRKMIAP